MIIHPVIKQKLPRSRLLTFQMDVKVKESTPEFWKEAEKILGEVISRYKLEDISQIPENNATREAYKRLGKDPSRYRPSAEALLRRVVNRKGLHKVNNVVDCLNLISVKTGYSIGGFDIGLIKGQIFLSAGDKKEYEAIGRGVLNIENLPALFDEIGAFGTPTSDSSRTMVTERTRNFLMVVYDFSGIGDLIELKELISHYYLTFCETKNIQVRIEN